MIRAILRTDAGLVPAFLVLAALLGAAAWWTARRRSAPVRAAVLFAVALAAELTATLYPTGSHAGASRVCSYSKDFAAALAGRQGVMNAAMYVPVALLGTAAFRRPLAVLAGSLLLSATTETAQALIPHIGRACDSQDVVANAAGAVIGVAVVCAVRPARRNCSVPSRAQALWSGGLLMAGAIVLVSVQRTAISPVWADAPLAVSRSADQWALAERDARALLGPAARIVTVQDQAALIQEPELLDVATSAASFSIEWPSGQLHDGHFGDFGGSGGSGTPRAGSDAEARAAARAFARRWFARDLAGATAAVSTPARDTARRDVSWRRYGPSGLLEPMRLDIEVDPGGRIVSFTSRTVPDPAVPAARITVHRAEAEVTAAHPGTVRSAVLLAVQVGAEWRPCWAVALTGSVQQPGPVHLVDAVTGSLVRQNVSE